MSSFITSPEFLCLLMVITVCGLLISGYPVAFVLAGVSLLFAFLGVAMDVFDYSFLTAYPQRIFDIMTREVLMAVPLFIFMGVMLERSKVAEELLDNMGKLFGSLRGGLALSVTVVGALMAASTGIVGATVVTMGLLSLPTMLKRGYSIPFATGSIAASGTLGQVIPPSIVLVLLGDQLAIAYQNAQFEQGIFAPDTVSVNDLFAGALLPGLFLVLLYLLYQSYVSWRHPEKAPAIPSDEIIFNQAFFISLIKSLIAPLVLIIAVLGSILGGIASPTEAAAVGAVGAIMLAGYRINEAKGLPILLGAACLVVMLILKEFFDLRFQLDVIATQNLIAIIVAAILGVGLAYGICLSLWRCWCAWVPDKRAKGPFGEGKETRLRVLSSVMRSTMEVTSMVFIILLGASMFSLVFRGFGGDAVIEEFLTSLPGGTLAAILLVMGLMFILGFFLDFLEIIFIVVPIVSPILLQMTFGDDLMNPVWLGIMMAMVLQTSFLTPPFGFALFYLRGVAPKTVRTVQIYKGVIPFIILQLLALVALWFWPNMATWLPKVLYGS